MESIPAHSRLKASSQHLNSTEGEIDYPVGARVTRLAARIVRDSPLEYDIPRGRRAGRWTPKQGEGISTVRKPTTFVRVDETAEASTMEEAERRGLLGEGEMPPERGRREPLLSTFLQSLKPFEGSYYEEGSICANLNIMKE